jgi:large subunit ribosomal protein L9
MEVILLTDVEKVGLRGEVVNVARGYMRNYLQPRGLAEVATPERVAELERRDAQRARHEARSFDHAQELAETLRKTVLRFEVNAGSRGRLFGSVTPTDIADEIWRARKIRVDRRKIDLPDTIKRIGRYEIPIDVFQDVRVEVKTMVVPQGGELPPDEEIAAWEEEERAEAAAAAGEDAAADGDEATEDAAAADASGDGTADVEAESETLTESEAEALPEPEPQPEFANALEAEEAAGPVTDDVLEGDDPAADAPDRPG